jgi:thiol-disulfide isomerase/thioredoxin
MSKITRTLTGLIIFLITSSSFSQIKEGYDISVNISGIGDSTVYLAYHFGEKQYVRDTLKLDHNGSGKFTGSKSLPQGIYMIVIPGNRYFEILMGQNQFFSVSCSFADFFKTLKFSGSAENSAFIDYQRKWVALQDEAGRLNSRLQANRQNKDSTKVLNDQRVALEKNMLSYLKSVVETNKGTLLAMVVKMIIPADMPDIVIPAGTKNPDSVRYIREYLYNKDHFFDNIDFSDERILRTPILKSKLDAFFTNVVIQLPDSINREIDRLIPKCTDYKVFQYVAVYLFNHFRESTYMGHDAIIVKLADDIYLSGKADWTTQEWRDNLKKEVDRIRPNLIGVKGHDLIMNSYKGIFVSLYDINKDFTILYFWEPDCGHCKEATPKLKQYYDKVRNQGVEVFAICTQTDKAKWEKYIEDNKLDWINGWDPQRTTNYDYYYNVTSTPGVYILDRNKKIIAKKLSVDDIGPFIENYRKYNKH